MEEFEKEVVKEISKQLPVKEIYEDGIKPIVRASSDIVALGLRAINAALEPLHKWVLYKEYNIEETKILLQQKLYNVPPELIVSPEPYVGVPVLQALYYSMDSDELRDMFANLLASSMVATIKNEVHPSFVEVIKQLSPDEARIVKFLPRIGLSVPVIDIGIEKEGEPGAFNHYNNFSILGNAAKCELPQNTPIYINNLCRLGIIEIPPNNHLVKEKYYEELMECEEFQLIVDKLPKYLIKRKMLGLTDYGDKFRKICTDKLKSKFCKPITT